MMFGRDSALVRTVDTRSMGVNWHGVAAARFPAGHGVVGGISCLQPSPVSQKPCPDCWPPRCTASALGSVLLPDRESQEPGCHHGRGSSAAVAVQAPQLGPLQVRGGGLPGAVPRSTALQVGDAFVPGSCSGDQTAFTRSRCRRRHEGFRVSHSFLPVS